MEKKTPSVFSFSFQGSPQRRLLPYLSPSSASSPLTPTHFLSSLTLYPYVLVSSLGSFFLFCLAVPFFSILLPVYRKYTPFKLEACRQICTFGACMKLPIIMFKTHRMPRSSKSVYFNEGFTFVEVFALLMSACTQTPLPSAAE